MGLNVYNITGFGRVGVRDLTWYEFEQWSRRAARAGRDLDDAFPELVGLAVKEIDGTPWKPENVGDVPPLSPKAYNVLQRLIGDTLAVEDEEREAVKETVRVSGNERIAEIAEPGGPKRIVRYRTPTLDEYQRARRSGRGAGVWLLDLMVGCLIDVDGQAAKGGVLPLSLREGQLYRAILADEVSADDDEIEAIKASHVRVEG